MKWHGKISLSLAAVATLFSAAAPPAAKAQQKQPNIVVIMADDVGWSNIGAYNMGMMAGRTPNLDKMAKQGMIFTDYYAEASCTAGRAAFLTGELPIRTGMTTVGQAGADIGLPFEAMTMATALKAQGYATGQFGKNHLGDKNAYLPTVHGFDEFFGYLYHLDAMEDPFHPAYPQELLNVVGPRNVLRSWATDTDDATVDPRWGKVGKQKIQDEGPLPPHPMAGIKYVLPVAQPDAHARCNALITEVRSDAQLEERLDRTGSRHGATGRQRGRGDAVSQGQRSG